MLLKVYLKFLLGEKCPYKILLYETSCLKEFKTMLASIQTSL